MGNYPRAASTSFRRTTVVVAVTLTRTVTHARAFGHSMSQRVEMSATVTETVMTGTSEPPLFEDGHEPLFSIQNSSDLSFLLGNPSQLALHACDEQIALGISPSPPRQFQSTRA